MNISSSLLSVTMDKKEANNKKKPRTFSKQRPRGAKGGWAHTQGERERKPFFLLKREREPARLGEVGGGRQLFSNFVAENHRPAYIPYN
jgi:hypothetical protein